ncbi:hypothetical protein BDV98DRAFT_170780 [Pterulicium gracile]|uniref:Uncharacterized protein n=1 Tax=Pterulicium gracile TaxID=1884261 RepID=A0A5C3QD74_9AGAR|nr:hypothetical protein BDV98DRAFT_170780 [Pterula gracilis]
MFLVFSKACPQHFASPRHSAQSLSIKCLVWAGAEVYFWECGTKPVFLLIGYFSGESISLSSIWEQVSTRGWNWFIQNRHDGSVSLCRLLSLLLPTINPAALGTPPLIRPPSIGLQGPSLGLSSCLNFHHTTPSPSCSLYPHCHPWPHDGDSEQLTITFIPIN